MIAVLAALASCLEPGAVLVPELRGKAVGQPGVSDTRVWISAGEPRAAVVGPGVDGAFAPGALIAVPAGVVVVEIGTERADANRVRLNVEPGLTSVVPMGLVAVTVEPAVAQVLDACRIWSASFELALQPLSGPGGAVVTRVSTEGATSLALVPAGYYRVLWNGGAIEVAVPPWTRYHVETGRIGPLRESRVQLSEFEGGPDALTLCERRATRVLARPWYASYSEATSEPPFRKKVWARVAVPADERRGGPFESLKRPKVKKECPPERVSAVSLWEAPE